MRMADSLAAVVLAAGGGTRLRPLTVERPKPLCPVGGVALVDHALARTATVVEPSAAATAVNVHHGRDGMEAHLGGLGGRAPTVSVEEPVALGTAGALGKLRQWLDGRDALVANSDGFFTGLDLRPFVDGWDRERVRLLCVHDPPHHDFGDLRYAGVALLPWREVAPLAPEPSGLYEVSWRRLAAAGAVDLVVHHGSFVDCGTPADYLAANLLASGGVSVIDPTARVDGAVERCVLWEGSVVRRAEHLVDAIRTTRWTVLVR
jgi:NDP-sugar pyrophosphorylase family protein